MKRLCLFAGMLLALGVLGLVSYVARELIAVLVLCTVAFTALLLIATIGVLVQRVAEGAVWLGLQSPQWKWAWRDWLSEFAHSLQGRHLWQRWPPRMAAPAAASPIPMEIERGA